MKKILLIGYMEKSFFFPWLKSGAVTKALPHEVHGEYFWFHARNPLSRLQYKLRPNREAMEGRFIRRTLRKFDKIITINIAWEDSWLQNPAFLKNRGKNSYIFLWDSMRCEFAPSMQVMDKLRQYHKVYSFQQSDCDAYGFSFNSTMYCMPPRDQLLPAPELKWDMLFFGIPKGRLPLLREIYQSARAQSLRPMVRISTKYNPEQEPAHEEGWEVFTDYVPYIEVLHYVQQSRAILDLYQARQTGFSLRVMEHIFFGKKLITDNAVIKEAEFYHPNNIFLLQERNIEELKDWLDLPFVPISEEIKEYYKFENWVERFV